ncbi:MAG: ABC transporter ATP-binding protein [Desulfamplus sp.]|nr:ABC transporter ATP-binding protein [Desulfamplus sp.]
MLENILEIKNLTHIYPDTGRGIKNISCSLKRGEFVIVAGGNGSGKSTFFRHLNGLMKPISGQVLLHGESINSSASALRMARQRVGMIFQDADCQIVGSTVYEDAAFGPENLKLPLRVIHQRVKDVLKRLDLWHLRNQNPATLSGGEKRSLAIAGVLAMEPEVIVMDEPCSNLDYPATLNLLSCIKELHRSGRTLVIATHDIEKVISMATRMIILESGEIRADGSPEHLVKEVEKFGIREPCTSKLGMVPAIMPWHS